MWLAILHASLVSLQSAALCHTLYNYVVFLRTPNAIPRSNLTNGGPFKFFTNWTLIIQVLTFGLSLFTDFFADPSLIELRDLLFNSLAFPFGLVVSFIFWFIDAIDPKMIRQEDAIVPNWKNQIIHTLPAVAALIDMCSVEHKCGQLVKELILMSIILFFYLCLVLYEGIFRNDWVYPLISKIHIVSKITFFLSCYFIIGLFQMVRILIYNIRWSYFKIL